MSEPRDCAECGEDVLVIGATNQFAVRVRRQTKCKFYLPPRKRSGFCRDICGTRVHETREAAVEEWNDKQTPHEPLEKVK
jgi:hypothetical protein